MKIIALDIDGVLNCSYTKERLEQYTFVMPCKIDLLKRLVDRSGAKVILSSTWRAGWIDLKEGKQTRDARHFIALRDKLLEHGVELLDHTPDFGNMNRRGEEIESWIENWTGEPIDGLVILDDMNGRYLRPNSNRHIRTSMAKGLLPKHVDLGVKLLKVPYTRKGLIP